MQKKGIQTWSNKQRLKKLQIIQTSTMREPRENTPFFKQYTDDTDNPTLNYNGGVAKQYDVARWRRCLAL